MQIEIVLKRILGIILIVTGLLVFYWDLSESYYCYTAQKEFPQVFIQPVANPTGTKSNTTGTIQDQMNALIGQQINDQMQKLVPGNAVTEVLNASVWSIFATILIYGASKAVQMGRDFLNDASKQDREDKIQFPKIG